MNNRLQFPFAPPEPEALLRLADAWAEQLFDATGAYRAVADFATTLAALSDGAAPRQEPGLHTALLAHTLSQRLRRDPLVARAWRRDGAGEGRETVLGDLMLRHPESEALVAGADQIGRNVFAATSALPACAAARDRRRMIARLADSVAERRWGADILGVAPGYMREAEASLAGPAGGIRRWVALVAEPEATSVIARAMPLPCVSPLHGDPLAMLLHGDSLGHFDLVYCKTLDEFDEAAGEAIIAACFARVRSGGTMLLGCRAPGAPDLAFWRFGNGRALHVRDEARLARLACVLPQTEIASRQVFPCMNGALIYLKVIKG